MAYQLPPLPYAYDALAPLIGEETMHLHHDKHHETYVTRLNGALEQHPDLAAKPIDDLLKNLQAVPESVRTAVRNHGGGHANHTMFWEIMAPAGSSAAKGAVVDAIQETYGGMQGFQEKFNTAAANHFGSGWVWLVRKAAGGLDILTLPNQDTPLSNGDTPLLLNDLWEHAYYTQYQNRKQEYFDAFMNLINWAEVDRRFTAAGG